MNRIATCLIMVALAGCATGPNPQPVRQAQADRARAHRKQMEERDARLRAQFESITVGMSRAEVRDMMGIEPQIKRDTFWGFKLSRASDTSTEIDWTLLVVFENGKVSKKSTSYTCVYRTLRE